MVNHRIWAHPVHKAILTAAFAGILLCGVSAQAQTTEAWASASDNYTNGPVGADWLPAIADSPTNWPNNFNGSASSASGYIVAITNSGTCNYAGSPAGDPNYTNTINDLYLGGTGNGTGGGGVANTFTMSGGSLTLSDSAGPSLTVGGNSTGILVGAQSTNVFTLSGGLLIATNAFTNAVVGDCTVGLGTNSTGTMNFNGGTAYLSDLTIGGRGTGVVNIAGANVTLWGVATRPIIFDTLPGASGTLNITSGTLTATNGLVTLGDGNQSKVKSIINMSGGIFKVAAIQFNGGTAATNIVNFSGGTIYFGSGTGRNGKTQTNFFLLSGGTISCLPGANPSLAGGQTVWILTNSPGPGVITFAPPAGQSITINDDHGSGILNAAGPGEVIEAGASGYTGTTIISGGMFSLTSAGSIASSVTVAGGATFDVSSLSVPFTLSSSQVLSNNTSTAIINGSLNTGSGTVSLLYTSGTPSFTVTTNSSANTNANFATLTLSASTTFNVHNTGPALAAGNYLIISTNSEGAAVAGTPPGTVTVGGGGIQAGNTVALSIGSDGQLYLVVAAKPPPPVIGAQFPITYTNLFTLYAGANPTYSVSASSALAINYQWYTNGVGIGGATNASLTLINVSAGVFSNYCIVTNLSGATTSIVWTASVIASPASYPQSVLARNPVAYWRLNDTNLDEFENGSGDDGYIANDYAGGNNGIYTNVSLGNLGYNPTTDPTDTSPEFGETGLSFFDSLVGQIEGVDFAITNGANAEFSVEAWVNGIPAAQAAGGGIVTKGVYNLNDAFNLGIDTAATKHYRFYVRNAAGTVYTADSAFAPDGNWHHLVGVCDEAGGNIWLYIDGQIAASATIPANSGAYEVARPITIGAGITNNATDYTLQFFGYVNDVALYNYALGAGQVATQYVSSGVAPALNPTPPSHATANGGGILTLTGGALGTSPLFYWWHDVSGGTNVLSGSTNGPLLNATLTVSNVPSAWNNDTLDLIVSNAFGGTNFGVSLTIFTNVPAITQSLPTPLYLLSGDAYTYFIGVGGATPDYYQWYSNTPAGAMAIANQTNATYGVIAPAVGATNTYFVVISNVFGAVTSTVSQLIGISAPAGSYATNILALNPVGYWPMHEIEAAAHGDIETNYGSIGTEANGYYGDWIGLQGITHSNTGAIINDPNTSVDFNYPGAANTGDATNSLIVPHNSPLATLNPPFTVECWFYPNSTGGGDVWGQAGAAGFDGGPNFAGIRCYWHASTIALECYNGASGNTLQAGPGANPFSNGQWHYVVVQDDGTNLYAYVDMIPNATNSAAKYAPDYWSPLSIGSSFGFQRSFNGAVDEFAVYTNALALTDITNHYNDGLTGAAGAYKADVLADNPVIYFRMDSPKYTPPSILPEMINYGSARNVGFYSPGTIPGAISGVTNSQGAPFIGLSGTNVPALSGVSSFGDAGYATIYNPTGAVPLSVTALFRGNPTDARDQTIVGHTTSSWRLWLSAGGNLKWQTAGATLTSSGIYNDGNWHHVVGVYAPASNPNVNGTNFLYVDGVLDNSSSSITTNGIIPGSTADVMIGADPQYTNNPDALGQQFAGQICEVALFTNALTGVQAQQLYAAINPVTVNTSPTHIVFSVANNQMTLSWPADHIGWELQAQTNTVSVGINTNWVPVSGSTTTNQIVIPVSLTSGCVFYRLVYPPQ